MSGYADENDRLSSLRADRYHAGLCVSCGAMPASECLSVLIPDALTHCQGCAVVEYRMRERVRQRGDKFAPPYHFMLVAK